MKNFLSGQKKTLRRRRSGARQTPSWWPEWQRNLPPMDKVFLSMTLGLCVFGLLMVYDASVVTAHRQFGDPYFFLKQQFMWLCLGLAGMMVMSRMPLSWWQRNSRKFLYITIALLILVLLGDKTLGARRWLTIAGFSLQPSELAKITYAAYISDVFLNPKTAFKEFLVASAVVMGLVMLQPDLGTTMVLGGVGMTIFWVAGAQLKQFLGLIGVGVMGVLGLIISSPYRLNRLTTFLNADADPLGTSYHVRQILLAVGSGGWFGLGLGQSRQKYAYLPEVAADSIFAVIAEELGFIGAGLLVVILTLFFIRGIRIAARAVNPYAKLFGTGLITSLAIQAFVNLAAMVAIVPLTGIPLPLISYGGSSLVVSLLAIGILLNISRDPQAYQQRK